LIQLLGLTPKWKSKEVKFNFLIPKKKEYDYDYSTKNNKNDT